MEELDYRPNPYARSLSKTRNRTFAALLPRGSQDAGYWALAQRGIRQAAEELAPHKTRCRLVEFDRWDSGSFRRGFHEAAHQTDGLLLAPVIPGVTRELLKAAGELPFLFFDTDIPDMPEKIAFVGQDSRRSGALAGKLMSLLLPEPGSVSVFRPPQENAHIDGRIAGFREYLRGEARHQMEIYRLPSGAGEGEILRYLTERERALRESSGYFVTDASAGTVAEWIRQDPKRRRPIIGYDLVPANVAACREGEIDFLLTQDPERQGYEGFRRLWLSTTLADERGGDVIMPLHVVTKENIDTITKNHYGSVI